MVTTKPSKKTRKSPGSVRARRLERAEKSMVDAAAACANAIDDTHRLPGCCRRLEKLGVPVTKGCCDGGCLTERPEIAWAAELDFRVAYAIVRLARAE